MLTNKIINKIFSDAGIKNHRLLNKHHSKYTEMDYQVLESIKNGKIPKNPFYVQKTNGELKKVIRISDGEIFDSVADCVEKTGLTNQKIYNLLNTKSTKEPIYQYLDYEPHHSQK